MMHGRANHAMIRLPISALVVSMMTLTHYQLSPHAHAQEGNVIGHVVVIAVVIVVMSTKITISRDVGI